MENSICKEHSGLKARIGALEGNVTELWSHWNGMQKMIIGIFIALSLNLIGVIIILIKGMA